MTLSPVTEVPPEYDEIGNAVLAFALGEGPQPEKSSALKEFYNWLFYEAVGNGDDDYELVVRPGGLQFDDDTLRCDLGLPDQYQISDADRLRYARTIINNYGNDGKDDPCFAQVIGLRRKDGKSAEFGYISYVGGQGGAYPECYGSFANKEAFLKSLRDSGWWILRDGAERVSDRDIMVNWYYPPDRKGQG